MAKVRLTCPECAARLTVPEEQAGKKGTCPACGAAVEVPPAGGAVQLAPAAGEQASAAGPQSSGKTGRALMWAGVAGAAVLALLVGYALWGGPLRGHKAMLTAARGDLARVTAEAQQAEAEKARLVADVREFQEREAAQELPPGGLQRPLAEHQEPKQPVADTAEPDEGEMGDVAEAGEPEQEAEPELGALRRPPVEQGTRQQVEATLQALRAALAVEQAARWQAEARAQEALAARRRAEELAHAALQAKQQAEAELQNWQRVYVVRPGRPVRSDRAIGLRLWSEHDWLKPGSWTRLHVAIQLADGWTFQDTTWHLVRGPGTLDERAATTCVFRANQNAKEGDVLIVQATVSATGGPGRTQSSQTIAIPIHDVVQEPPRLPVPPVATEAPVAQEAPKAVKAPTARRGGTVRR